MNLIDSLNSVIRYGLEDHASFQKQIHDNSAVNEMDYTTPLVYADWLEEQGKPTHAELIRKAIASEHPYRQFIAQSSPRSPEQEFRTHVWSSDVDGPTTFNIDLSSQKTFPHRDGGDGNNRLVWSLNGIPDRKEAMRLVTGLHKEGATADPNALVQWGLAEHNEEAEKRLNGQEPYRNALKYSLADEGSFHSKLVEQPDDHTAHGVYADYLQENGKENTANFIRTTARLGGIQSWTTPQTDHSEWALHHYGDDVGGHMLELTQAHNGHVLSWRKTYGVYPEEVVKGLQQDGVNLKGALEDNEVHAPVAGEHNLDEEGHAGEMPVHFATEGAVKYKAVPEHDIHDDYKQNGIAPRIGAGLQAIAEEHSDLGLLAEGIVRTGDHSLLKILADKLDEDGHPGKDWFDWRHAERGIRIDRALKNKVGEYFMDHFHDGVHSVHGVTPGWVFSDWSEGARGQLSRRRALEAVRKHVPDATRTDVSHSILRLLDQQHLEESAEYRKRGEDNWYPQDITPPEHRSRVDQERITTLGVPSADVHKYPDTRPPNKRVYRLQELKAKYQQRLRQPVEYGESLKRLQQTRDNWHSAPAGTPYPSDELLSLASYFRKSGDPRAEIVQAHADYMDGVGSDSQKGAQEHIADTSISRNLHHSHIPLSDGSHLMVRSFGHYELPGVHAVQVSWHPKSGSAFSWSGGAREARQLATRFGSMDPAAAQKMTDHLNVAEGKGDWSAKYGAWKAPAGGLVVKESPLAVSGSYVQGGQFTTDLADLKPTPQPTKKKWTLAALMKRLRSKR